MARVEVTTQAELDAALAKAGPSDIVACTGSGWFSVRESSHVEARGSSYVVARESSRVVARESSRVEAWDFSRVVAWESSRVVARESSHVEALESSRVVAWDFSHVVARDFSRVVAWGSSHVEAWESSRVVAWESSRVVARESSHVEALESSRVVAWDFSHVEARGSSHVEAGGRSQIQAKDNAEVKATKYVAVTIDRRERGAPKVTGGVLIEIPPVTTAEEWLAMYDLVAVDGLVALYKAVDDDYSTRHARNQGVYYRPGSSPEVPDWDAGPECGRGLHFCPTPGHARMFNREATRYVACPVRVSEIVVHSPCAHVTKIKAPRVAGPIVEVDVDGQPVAAAPGKEPKT